MVPTIVTDYSLPDGIVVDADAGHIYWSNMGIPDRNDGTRPAAPDPAVRRPSAQLF
jgi:hypothetical protein